MSFEDKVAVGCMSFKTGRLEFGRDALSFLSCTLNCFGVPEIDRSTD